MSSFDISTQLDVENGLYEPDELPPVVEKQKRDLECEFLRQVKDNVATAYMPREIRLSVNAIDRKCSKL